MIDSLELRQKVIDTCKMLREKGLVFGTWGNISVRLNTGNILITPSKIDYDVMEPDDLVVLATDGSVVSGTRLSTSERELHRGILNKRKDVNVIIHTHSAYAMMAAARDTGVPVISEEMCQLLGGPIPLTSKFVPSQEHVALGEEVVASLTDTNAILIRNHGPMCFGRTLEETMVCCQVVEKACQMYINLLATGSYCKISDGYVKAGRDYFLYSYGKS